MSRLACLALFSAMTNATTGLISCAKVVVPAGKNSTKPLSPASYEDLKKKKGPSIHLEEGMLTANQPTFLKASQEDSRMFVSGRGLCDIPEGGTLHFSGKLEGHDAGHQEVQKVTTLKDAKGTTIPCELTKGFVFAPHFADKKSVSSMPEDPSDEKKKDPAGSQDAFTTGEPSAEGYVWPTVKRKIRSDAGGDGNYGTARVNGRTHKGIDIAGEVGDKLYAIKEGILSVGEDPDGYGHYTVIDHSPSIYSLYGHLSKYTIKSNGATVTRGQEIGLIGRSGNAIGSNIGTHVHFEIRYDKNAVDPTKKLP